jgi:hypothetical protein
MKRITAVFAAALAAAVPFATGAAQAASYYNMHTLDSTFQRLLDQRLATRYHSSVRASQVECILESRNSAACFVRLTNGESSTYSVVIGVGGESFLVK